MDRRRKRRVATCFPVRVWGMDAKNQPFEQTARVVNISKSGALVEGMLRALKAGDVVHVQFDDEQAEFRIVWIGKPGTLREGQVGIKALPAEPMIWNVNLTKCAEAAST